MEYFAGGLTVCARVFSALSRHLESGVDPGNEVASFPENEVAHILRWNTNMADEVGCHGDMQKVSRE